jgi:hypothetical protein
VSNQPYRTGAFEIPCRADWGVTTTRDAEGRPFVPAAARGLRPRLVAALERVVVFLMALPAIVRGWVGSLNTATPLASLIRIGASAKQ